MVLSDSHITLTSLADPECLGMELKCDGEERGDYPLCRFLRVSLE
jgi:hypothetical protein